MKFLVDNNLAPALARALSELCRTRESRVEGVFALKDRFAADTPDNVWISALAAEGGWNIVSADNFRKGSAEKEIMRRAGFNVFVLQKYWASQQYWPKASQLVLWWPKIIEYASQSQHVAARVPWKVTGKFEHISF